VRRLDYSVPDQSARVLVNGAEAGLWTEPPGSDAVDRWRDSRFTIPAAFTAGQSVVQVQLQSLGAGRGSWTEFRYGIYSLVGGQEVKTDELDIGDLSSGSA